MSESIGGSVGRPRDRRFDRTTYGGEELPGTRGGDKGKVGSSFVNG